MLNPPSGITMATFLTYLRNNNPVHVKLEMTGQDITLDDDDIESTGIQISTYMNSETDLTVGSTAMTEVLIPVVKTENNTDIINEIRWNGKFTLYFGIENDSGTTKWVKYGVYSGTRPDRIAGEDIINWTAYDDMRKLDRSIDEFMIGRSASSMPISLLLNYICSFCGVRSSGSSWNDLLPNIASMEFQMSRVPTGITCREFIGMVAEAGGCYVVIDSDNYIKMRWFNDNRSVYTLLDSDEYSPITAFEHLQGKTWKDLESYKWSQIESFAWIDFEDSYDMLKINGIRVVSGENDVGVYYPGDINGNIYTIENNPLLSIATNKQRNLYLKPLYQRLTGLPKYVPINVTCSGNPLVEVGDIINVTVDGETVPMPIFNIVRTFNGALTDTYETTGNFERENTVVSSSGERMDAGNSRHIFINDFQELRSEIVNTSSNYSTLFDQVDRNFRLYYIHGSDSSEFNLGNNIGFDTSGEFRCNATGVIEFDSTDEFIVRSSNINIGYGEGITMRTSDTLANYQTDHLYYESYTGSERTSRFTIGTGSSTQNEALKNAFITYSDTFSDPEMRFSMAKKNNSDVYEGAGFVVTMGDLINEQSTTRHVVIKPIRAEETFTGILGDLTSQWYWLFVYGINAQDVYANEIHQPSSREVKEDIKPLPDFGSVIDKLYPVSFAYKDDKGRRKRFGLIYEDTVDVLPEICVEKEDKKAIDYVDLIPVLLKEIQSLRHRVAELENK